MLSCSFCNKTQDNVKKLVTGKDVAICDECILVSFRILIAPDMLDFMNRVKIIEEKINNQTPHYGAASVNICTCTQTISTDTAGYCSQCGLPRRKNF